MLDPEHLPRRPVKPPADQDALDPLTVRGDQDLAHAGMLRPGGWFRRRSGGDHPPVLQAGRALPTGLRADAWQGTSARTTYLQAGGDVRQLRRGMTPLIIGWIIMLFALVSKLEFAD